MTDGGNGCPGSQFVIASPKQRIKILMPLGEPDRHRLLRAAAGLGYAPAQAMFPDFADRGASVVNVGQRSDSG